MTNEEYKQLMILTQKLEQETNLSVIVTLTNDERLEDLFHKDEDYFEPLEIYCDLKLQD